MARVVEVGTPEHEEGVRRMAAQLAEIRAGWDDHWRNLDLGPMRFSPRLNGHAGTQTTGDVAVLH
jgi:hypothetical protein